jgi:hypothetical protein
VPLLALVASPSSARRHAPPHRPHQLRLEVSRISLLMSFTSGVAGGLCGGGLRLANVARLS